MFDLSSHSYEEVQNFLNKNIKKRIIKPCVPIQFDSKNKVIYELIIVSIDDEYFDDPNKNFNLNSILFEKSYYYVLKYNDDSLANELSVLDCGGYFIAICIFKNKINITNEYVYNKKLDGDNTFQKFHMNTKIGKKIRKNNQKILKLLIKIFSIYKLILNLNC